MGGEYIEGNGPEEEHLCGAGGGEKGFILSWVHGLLAMEGRLGWRVGRRSTSKSDKHHHAR